ncbi:hypothetical protein [Sphingobacterium sp.]|uniref:hypothetical protein n=1 Tax=Sphingobacterium sp. TaxID=341027 RepID=UPI0028AC4D7B|nr:hypothetical protein [Sphingobacterium sp.]
MANKHDLERSILELQGKRSQLGLKKQKIQADLSETREMLKVVKQNHETFADLVMRKKNLTADLDECELEIMKLKQDIKKRQNLKVEAGDIFGNSNKTAIVKLTVTRDHYQQFASDKTRVSSMRIMASEIAEKLTQILKEIK